MATYALQEFHIYLDTPAPIFRARLNMPGTITYPITALTFDTVTLGAYTDVVTDMTLILGTTLGADDLGRVRVQNVATSTTIPVGYISQGLEDGTLTVVDNCFVEAWEDFRVWARIPREIDGIFYKDADFAVSDYMTEIPPVSNCGIGTADYIDPITEVITVTFPSGGSDLSYAMADGATIATYAWDVKGGTITVGTSASAVITATFPPGKWWVALTVVDSNGKSHISRCPVVAIDPANDVTAPFKVGSHRIAPGGQQFEIRILNDLSRTTFPDGGLVMFWADSPADPELRDHMKFIGWHQSDNVTIRATPQGNIRETTLQCLDVAGRLDTLPGFPQALERGEGEENEEEEIVPNWAYMPNLTLRKALHYLAHWHSTALALADFILPDELEDYPSMRLDSTGSSLYDQINSRAQSAVPDYWFTCNTKGQLSVRPDWMLLDFNDRPDAAGRIITEDNWSDLQVTYNRPPKFYALRSSAVVCSEDWLMLGGEQTLPLAFCIAPGNAFAQGVAESVTGEKLTPSQEVLNHCEGHRWARINARYGTFTITLPTEDISDFEPASMLPAQLNISATTAAQRGLDATELRGLVKSIDLTYNETPGGTWVQPRLTFEREVEGAPAVTVIPEVPEDPDYETPDPPPVTVPPDGLREGVERVVGISASGHAHRI